MAPQFPRSLPWGRSRLHPRLNRRALCSALGSPPRCSHRPPSETTKRCLRAALKRLHNARTGQTKHTRPITRSRAGLPDVLWITRVAHSSWPPSRRMAPLCTGYIRPISWWRPCQLPPPQRTRRPPCSPCGHAAAVAHVTPAPAGSSPSPRGRAPSSRAP